MLLTYRGLIDKKEETLLYFDEKPQKKKFNLKYLLQFFLFQNTFQYFYIS